MLQRMARSAMAHFDIADKVERDVRRCKTHALVACLFAIRPVHQSNSDVWENVASSWDDLASLKERIMKSAPPL